MAVAVKSKLEDDPFALPSYAAPGRTDTGTPETPDLMTPSFMGAPSEPSKSSDPFSPADLGGGSGQPSTPTTVQGAPTQPTAGGLNPVTGTIMGTPAAATDQHLGGGGAFNEDTGQSSALGGAPDKADPYTPLVSQVQQATDPAAAAMASDQLGRTLYADLQEAGHTVKWDGDQLIVDGRPYVLAGAPTAAGQPAAVPRSGPAYTPGAIDTLDNFTAGAGPVNPLLERNVTDLLEHPESLDARTVDMMKAKNREEQSALAAQGDEELLRYGFQGGFDDSRWLASERANNTRSRDESIIKGNRDIEIGAATTNAADKRSAVAAGQSYQALTADTAFRTAALQGDRMALREAVNQRAAELGLSGDQLQVQYTLGLINDFTQRYGIDVGAQLSREQLSQASREHLEEIAFKFAQLQQMDAQFGADYGLQLEQFNANERQRQFDNQFRLTDQGGA